MYMHTSVFAYKVYVSIYGKTNDTPFCMDAVFLYLIYGYNGHVAMCLLSSNQVAGRRIGRRLVKEEMLPWRMKTHCRSVKTRRTDLNSPGGAGCR